MKIFVLMTIAIFVLIAAGCNYTGKPVEFARLCDRENHNQYVEVSGFFKNNGSAMCSSKSGRPTECTIAFTDSPEQVLPVLTHLELGSGRSSIEKSDSNGLVIHDEQNRPVANTDRVKLTAEAFVPEDKPSADAVFAQCILTVKKIEKIN